MITRKVIVTGMVQGIGYRPYVAKLAQRLEICGQVRNASGVVIIVATANRAHLDILMTELKDNPPPGAQVKEVITEELPLQLFDKFVIADSQSETNEEILCTPLLIPPDLPVCSRCVEELTNPEDRRYGYPFISCTACGPRYSIIRSIPYDRCNTTMDSFEMCEDCGGEYTAPYNIRRHAQTIACHHCGPQLTYMHIRGKHGERGLKLRELTALNKAVECICSDGIVAVKDIGGFHLVCSPYSEQAVRQLRLLKGREKKPFAVMFQDTSQADKYCIMCPEERDLLESSSRPVVLVSERKIPQKVHLHPFVKGVCGDSPYVGAMLYCNPLQLLLLQACGPLIMTSANSSGEPIITDNKEMLQWAEARGEIANILGLLMHEREIVTPLDDSVLCMTAGMQQIFRRSRGFVPQPVCIGKRIMENQSEHEELCSEQSAVFAAGGDMKAVFCYAENGYAYMSQYFGDLQQEKILDAYFKEIQRMKVLFGFKPELYVCDLHPGYLSGRITSGLAEENGGKVLQIQHHHAHIASVMAEHHLVGEVLGVAFDGTGFGTDHTIWGSEFLWCRKADFIRSGHLKTVSFIGGDESARNADLSLYGYLTELERKNDLSLQKLRKLSLESKSSSHWFDENQYEIIKKVLLMGTHASVSSSMGRLFDAVSALLDICHYNTYEGEAAMLLEYAAAKAERAYPLQINIEKSGDGEWIGNWTFLFTEIINALYTGADKYELAAGFIRAVSDFTVRMCLSLIKERDCTEVQIALSGGCFQNRILLSEVVKRLQEKKYKVYINEQVPAGDGGIALGQVYLAAVMSGKNR